MKGIYRSRGTLEQTLHQTTETQEETNWKQFKVSLRVFEGKLCHDFI